METLEQFQEKSLLMNIEHVFERTSKLKEKQKEYVYHLFSFVRLYEKEKALKSEKKHLRKLIKKAESKSEKADLKKRKKAVKRSLRKIKLKYTRHIDVTYAYQAKHGAMTHLSTFVFVNKKAFEAIFDKLENEKLDKSTLTEEEKYIVENILN